MHTAQLVANCAGNDGKVFVSPHTGEHISIIARREGAVTKRQHRGLGQEYTVYEFADGSAIVISPGSKAWDLRAEGCTCGTCWDASGERPTCLADGEG